MPNPGLTTHSPTSGLNARKSVTVLPDHLFAHPESPSMEYVATRTKPENYDSDSGYESDGTDDTRHVVKELSDDS